jgi:small conductance mechanosensitive channel
MEKLTEGMTELLLAFALAASVILVGYLLVRFLLLKLFRRFMRRYGVDEVFVKFASIVLNILLMSLVFIIALEVVGVKTSYLIAALAVVLVALLAAMQGWLQNVAAGLWMFLDYPFKLNDLVEIAGKQGRVEEISLLTTKLRTRDNLEIILPNRTIVGNIITNFHTNPERRIELEIYIAFEEDIQQAIDVIQETIRSEMRILTEPEPIVAVADLGLNGVKLDVRPWVKQEDFTSTRYALRQNIKLALDAHNIALPYQQVQLHTSGKAE